VGNLLLDGRDVPLGRYTTVRRLLPHKERRTVGAWCFLDHFGPVDITGAKGMDIGPHPHVGLQTVTWLLAGEIIHRDSLGSVQSIRPGQLNLMTAGAGIAHSEESLPLDHPDRPALQHGLQLWVALPEGERDIAPRFEHHDSLPVFVDGTLTATVLLGDLAGVRSPAEAHTPLVGAQLAGAGTVPLEPAYEHAILALGPSATVEGAPLAPGALLYLGQDRDRLDVSGPLFLIGGEPLEEDLLMWWNFVARTHEEIVAARDDWAAGRRFGPVHGYPGDPIPAPALPTTRLLPRHRTP
jgi:redox-sensitive bicupin YhaK (pirin superfamily)